jgi:hypothetical protein
MFGWLKRYTAPVHDASKTTTAAATEPSGMSMRDLLGDRKLLAEWVEKYMILGHPWEENFQLLPDEDAQRDLEITFEQKERVAKEYHVLRIAGVLILLRQHYEDGKYEAVLNDLAGRLAKALSLQRAELGQALSEYVRYSLAGETESVERLYLSRMYDDNSHYLRMKLAGIGTIAPDCIGSSFDIFRDAINGRLPKG